MMIDHPHQIDEYYSALCARDSHYVGIFYAAIRTTGIFCLPTCRARKPKVENVVFYTTKFEAVNNGFRPCKICRPMENQDNPPARIQLIFDRLKNNPEERIRDQDLLNEGIQPAYIRRWFKKHMGMTFQQYQRNVKLEAAHLELENGGKVTEAAFSSGYESLSGFSHSFRHLLHTTPNDSRGIDLIKTCRLTTPLGPMIACADSSGLKVLEFVDNHQVEEKLRTYRKKLGSQMVYGINDHLEKLDIQLKDYFEGKRLAFDVKLDPVGTEFQKNVWQKLLNVPYGQTISYKEQAMSMSNLNAIRAIARANGQNPIAIVIPCHRIIGSNGKLTGYAGGLARKKWLLQHEFNNKPLGDAMASGTLF